ncbi:60S ribosomal protein L31 [Candidatus Woesearchaeota archaeon]|nr:60S ribosomal protein L31 [Candidatus Woesearchaeota archaeon]
MASKDNEKEIKRTYNVPLRKGFINTPKYKRTKKAVSTLKLFIKKHMKTDNVKIKKELNDHLWKKGIKNPPHHVRVDVIKKDNIAYVNLEGKSLETEEKKKAPEGKIEEIKEKLSGAKKKDSKPKKPENKEQKDDKKAKTKKKTEKSSENKKAKAKSSKKKK